MTYDLPAGASVEGAPPDAKVSWESHAVYIVKSKSENGQITVARVIARAFDLARPLDYQDLRDFYQKVAAADQGQLVFTVVAGQKGHLNLPADFFAAGSTMNLLNCSIG